MKIYTLADLSALTQELLNDPNMAHRNVTEKAAIYGHAATVLSAERYAATLDKMSTTMTAAMEAQLGEDFAGDIARDYNPPVKKDQESSQ